MQTRASCEADEVWHDLWPKPTGKAQLQLPFLYSILGMRALWGGRDACLLDIAEFAFMRHKRG